MATTRSGIPTTTSQFPHTPVLPFNPAAPFAAATLGVLMAGGAGATAAPGAGLYTHKVSAGIYDANSNSPSAGGLLPLALPTSMVAGTYWLMRRDDSDGFILCPYLVKYDANPPTAYAAAPAAGAIDGRLDIWGYAMVGAPLSGWANEYKFTFKGAVTLKNGTGAPASGTRRLPTGAQFCDKITLARDVSLSPGIRILGNGEATAASYLQDNSAAELLVDAVGEEGLLVYASGLTANCGVGWMHRPI